MVSLLIMMHSTLENKTLIAGTVFGPILYAETGLSFWGGVDPLTGIVTDQHHPLFGQCISGSILFIPSGRGSCTGSCVMLELIINGVAPAALIFNQNEDILPLGVMIADEIFGQSLPVLQMTIESFSRFQAVPYAVIQNNQISVCDRFGQPVKGPSFDVPVMSHAPLQLCEKDNALLNGEHGLASQLAMKIIIRMANLYGASHLIDVSQAHIDACIYIGPAGLSFVKKLCSMGGKTAVPTTLNAVSIDRRNWRAQGISNDLGEPAEQLAEAFVMMGARPSYTCAPYLLAGAPCLGENIAWAESNAVVFANSVIGARTMKYPDYLDVCVALTGRTPFAGCYEDDARQPKLVIEIAELNQVDDSFFPLLGYHIGLLAPNAIPFIKGIAHLSPTRDDLKAFGAAFATTSAAPMFHIEGVTPEASSHGGLIETLPHQMVSIEDLRESWTSLNSAKAGGIDLIAIGNPHASYAELELIAGLCARYKSPYKIKMIITCGRDEYERARTAGFIDILTEFGVQFLTDTCWCMVTEPIIPSDARVIMTNSGKYAHYAPALTGRTMRFGSLDDCLKAACGDQIEAKPPSWLVAA